jgi:hypothetical protein
MRHECCICFTAVSDPHAWSLVCEGYAGYGYTAPGGYYLPHAAIAPLPPPRDQAASAAAITAAGLAVGMAAAIPAAALNFGAQTNQQHACVLLHEATHTLHLGVRCHIARVHTGSIVPSTG